MKPEDLAWAPPARLPFPVTRALASAVECRSIDGKMPTMTGHFSTFGDWYEVDSWIEGHFLESIKPGAFRKTIAESRDSMKVLYDHGQDPTIGNKVLGQIESLAEDKVGPAYAVPLFDTSYNRDLQPGLEAGVYGSSFRFSVEKDAWDQSPEKSAHNPNAYPERTITEARVFEFGPVTFPANPNATAGVRSTTDAFYQRSRDPEAFETLLRSAQVARTPAPGAAPQPAEPPSGTPEATPPEPPRSDTPPAIVEPPAVAVIPDPKESRTVDYITRDEKTGRIEEIKSELSRMAVEFPGVLPAGSQATWDGLCEEQDALERDVVAWDVRQARIEANAKNSRLGEPPAGQPTPFNVIRQRTDAEIHDIVSIRREAGGDPERTGQLLRDNAMRVVERATFPHPSAKPDKARESIANLLDFKDTPDKELAQRVITTGSPQYQRFFNKYVTGGHPSPEEQRAALEVHVTTTGGFAVPFAFDPTLVATGAWTTENPYRAACRVETVVGSNEWRGLSSGAVTAAYGAEAAVTAESSPTFAQPAYVTQRATCLVQYSIEMDQDYPNLASDMARLISEAKDTLEESQFSVGVGTTVYPRGMAPAHGTAGMYTHIDTIGHVAIEAADLYAMEAALPIRHRSKAAFFMSKAAMRAFAAYETDHGALFGGLYYPGPTASFNAAPGTPKGTLLGYPLYEAPSIVYSLVDNTMIAWLGDPKSYVIVDRAGLNVEVIPHLVDATGQPFGMRGLYALWRNFAAPFNVDAGRLLGVL